MSTYRHRLASVSEAGVARWRGTLGGGHNRFDPSTEYATFAHIHRLTELDCCNYLTCFGVQLITGKKLKRCYCKHWEVNSLKELRMMTLEENHGWRLRV